MRLAPVTCIAGLSAAGLAASTPELFTFVENVAIQTFPNHTNWQTAYNEYFDKSLAAEYRITSESSYTNYTFATFQSLYTQLQHNFTTKLSYVALTFTDSSSQPSSNDSMAGSVFAVATETGTYLNGTSAGSGYNTIYAIVKDFGGTQRITNWTQQTSFNP